MTKTPWGNAGELRGRKLNPGLGTPRREVARNQRERLFGAMVASVATKGYDATSVADLIALSGVSRRTFYEHFDDKQTCFVATIMTLLEAGTGLLKRGYDGEGSWQEWGRRALEDFLRLVAAQPAAARLCIVEVYAAGEAALAPLRKAVDEVERVLLSASDGQTDGDGAVPPELVRAGIGGLHQVVYRRLSDGREAELAGSAGELWDWVSGLAAPPQPLQARGRRGGRKGGAAPPFAAHIPGERVLRGFAAAVAEKGYAGVTIADVAAAARISQATFYAHFRDKEDALFAALDSSGAQMVAATVPAVRRAGEGPAAVRTAIASVCGFLAAEPAFARLRAVEAYAAGPRAVEQRDRTTEELIEVTLALSFQRRPELSPLTLEATMGAINGILFERVRDGGPATLPEATPLATYVALAPFLGPEQACEVALGD